MKKSFLIITFSILLIVAASCSNKEVSEKGPSYIPVDWVNAQIQNDQAKMLDLLDEKTTALSANEKARNKETIEVYRLTEWKVNDNHYFYMIEYQDPTLNNRLKTEKLEVIKTDSGWKRTKYGNLVDFDKLVRGLKPEVLKELFDE